MVNISNFNPNCYRVTKSSEQINSEKPKKKMSTAKKIRIGAAATALATVIAVPTYFAFKKPTKLQDKVFNAGLEFVDNISFCAVSILA